MGASQLGIYNKALRYLEERKLANLEENREPRRYLDDEWTDAIEWCLYQGYFLFSIREIEVTFETTLTPQFGYQYCFRMPDDLLRTYMLADNEGYNPLARNYVAQNNLWYADTSPLFVKYVSSDARYGFNLGLWTPGFSELVAAYLAWICAPRLKQANDKVDRIEKIMRRKLSEALANDAQELPPGRPPYGTWVQSRAPRGSILPYGSPFAGLPGD